MKTAPLLLGVLLLLPLQNSWAQKVYLQFDTGSPQANYAATKLRDALVQRGYQLQKKSTGYDYYLGLATQSEKLSAEAFAIIPQNKVISILGGDNRGLIYGALELVELLLNGTALQDVEESRGAPDQAFRGIKFNLPWQTYRPSTALTQHTATARDLNYWEAFFDMMVENRFNAISLWNMHPYTYMILPKNFPEASPWSQKELAKWQALYHGIFRLAKERALDTYIVHWNIFVSEAFAKAHNVASQNFYPHYYVPGDTSEIVKQYMRESVTQVLEEYPNLDGIGLSHGEGMANMTPLQRQEWMDEVMIAGMLQAKRPVKLIHRVPFSSGKSSEPGVSKNVEIVTREAMEKLESRFEGPIWVEIKFNWSHGHSTPKLEKVHGGQLGDTYFKPLPKNYKITWQVRNEDFFALRWGVPEFIREHIARNGKASYTGGYFVGSETYIPALDYFTAAKEPVDWQWAFQRQWLFYKLWGRLLYNPKTPDAVFQAEYNLRYGEQGNNLLAAISLASNTQLQLASLYDSRWDFTLYSEGFLALQGDYTRYISVAALMDHPTMASEYVSVTDFVKTELAGGAFGQEKMTPDILADNLERDNRKALNLVANIDTSKNTSLLYEVADIKTWAYLGLHLAEKLRGAVALKTYLLSGDAEFKSQAVTHLTRALAHWDSVIAITRPLYRDMKLTHYNHNFFDANDDNLFHWALIRDEVADDISIAQDSKFQ